MAEPTSQASFIVVQKSSIFSESPKAKMKDVVFRKIASCLIFGGVLTLVAAVMWRPVLQRYWRIPDEFIW